MSQADTNRRPVNHREWQLKNRNHLILIITLLLCISLTALSYISASKTEQEHAVLTFQRYVQDHTALLETRLSQSLTQIRSVAYFFNASDFVTRSEFNTFVEPILNNNSAFHALEWIPRVSAEQKKYFEQQARIDGFLNFTITQINENGSLVTANKRDTYLPVYYVQPQAGNENAMGYDLALNKEALGTLIKSRDTAQLAASSRIKLLSGENDAYGFLVSYPVYKKGVDVNTFAQRNEHLLGFVLGIFSYRAMLVDVIDAVALDLPINNSLEINVFDQTGSAPIFATKFGDSNSVTRDLEKYAVVIKVASRDWRVEFRADDIFTTNDFFKLSEVILIVGFFSSLIVIVLLLSVITRAEKSREYNFQLMQKQLSLEHLVKHDPLTEIYNRREFESQILRLINHSKVHFSHHCVMFIDLDKFKLINDTYGHLAGDRLLREVIVDLKRHIRGGDTLARLGGDEFGLLVQDCTVDSALSIAETVRKTFEDFRFFWENKHIRIGVSIGMTSIDNQCVSIDTIMSTADMACYIAKRAGRNRVEYRAINNEIIVEHRNEMQLAKEITEALEDDRIILYRQQIVAVGKSPNIETRFEILSRAVDKNNTLILPDNIFPLAERHNFVRSIDKWIVLHVFDYLSKCSDWHQCFINISAQSITSSDILETILEALALYNVPPHKLCFELTETTAIANLDSAVKFISILHQQGCSVALDDFGTGMASFAYLSILNVDYLKIDGVFIKDLKTNMKHRAIVKSMTDVAKALKIKTIAEFVEDEDVMEILLELGIDYAQGFAISKPIPAIC
jgi:diguanylate cyclase (GGDEF)-like protein